MSVNSNLNIARGKTGIISITVTSKPEVKSIRWKKGNGSTAKNIQFTDSTKYESIGPLNSPKLKIINADESDTGFYTCIAGNGHPHGSVVFEINVGGMLFFFNKYIIFHIPIINIYRIVQKVQIHVILMTVHPYINFMFIFYSIQREWYVSYYQDVKNL
jgi:hypothetical protein